MESDITFVRRRLAADTRSLAKIAMDAKIGRSWLEKFARGNIANPGYLTVAHMARYYRRLGK